MQPAVQGGNPLAIWPVVSSVQPPYTACRPAGPGGYLTDVLSTRHRGGSTQRTVAGQGPAAPPGRGASTALGDAPGKLFPRRQNGRSCDCRRGEHPTGRCPKTIPGHLTHRCPIFRTSLHCKQTSMALRFWFGCRASEGSLWGEWRQRGAGQSKVERERPKSRLPLFPLLSSRALPLRREMCPSSRELPTLTDQTLQRSSCSGGCSRFPSMSVKRSLPELDRLMSEGKRLQ